METLRSKALFKIDDQCPTPMFRAEDVSVQHIEHSGIRSNWAFFIELDDKSQNGYLAAELPKCMSANHLPRTQIRMQVYAHEDNCCDGIKDYDKCKHCRITPLDHHWRKEPLAFEMVATGTQFTWRATMFVLEGTKYTSKTSMNFVKIGEPVNGGNVKATNGPSFVEL